MAIYNGGNKVCEYKNYGIVHDNKNIVSVYRGNKLVYQYEPYKPSSEVLTVINGDSQTIKLPIGVYSLYITAGGGNQGYDIVPIGGSSWASWGFGGASGASWEGEFYNPIEQNITLSAGEATEISTMKLGTTQMISCPAGGNKTTSGTSAPTVNSELDVVSTYKSVGGNGGDNGGPYSQGAAGGTSTSTYKWGCGTQLRDGQYHYGGCKLIYLRLKK